MVVVGFLKKVDFELLYHVILVILRTHKKLLKVSRFQDRLHFLRSKTKGALCRHRSICSYGTLLFCLTCSISPISAILLVSQHLCLISSFWRWG